MKVTYLRFVLFVLFVRVKSFRKKNKTTLIPSFILLLNSSLHHNIFQLSEYFSMVTIFFDDHNIFQLSQYFSIITTFMKISQNINSII